MVGGCSVVSASSWTLLFAQTSSSVGWQASGWFFALSGECWPLCICWYWHLRFGSVLLLIVSSVWSAVFIAYFIEEYPSKWETVWVWVVALSVVYFIYVIGLCGYTYSSVLLNREQTCKNYSFIISQLRRKTYKKLTLSLIVLNNRINICLCKTEEWPC